MSGLALATVGGDEPALAPSDLARLARFLESRCGIQLPREKHLMLAGRLRKRLRSQDVKDFGAYCTRVMAGDEAELVALVDLVTTNETNFFREPRHFEFLARLAHRGGLTTDALRVWSAACSTGEEAWTLAMVLSEITTTKPGFLFRVLASDICGEALEHARRAIYPEPRAEPIPLALRRKYLSRRIDGEPLVRVTPALRRLVRFERINLMDRDLDRNGPFEVIFCRNVFIYFARDLQRQILLSFTRALVPGGHLFLGHAESLHGLDVPFTQVAPTVYRKEGT